MSDCQNRKKEKPQTRGGVCGRSQGDGVVLLGEANYPLGDGMIAPPDGRHSSPFGPAGALAVERDQSPPSVAWDQRKQGWP